MIYVTETQFSNLKLNLIAMLERLGTGMKSRKLDEAVAKILGFKDFNTYLSIGKIDTAEQKHLDIISARIINGDLCGKLDFNEKSYPWFLSIDYMPKISYSEVFNKSLKIPRTPYELVTNAQFNELVDSKCDTESWRSDIADSLLSGDTEGKINIDGDDKDWFISGGPFDAWDTMDRVFETAELALVAENISLLFKDQIGNKVEEMTLIFCGGEDNIHLSEIGFDFIKSFDEPVNRIYSIGMFKDAPTDIAESDSLQGIFLERHRILKRYEKEGRIHCHLTARFTIDLTVTSEDGKIIHQAGIGTEFDEEQLAQFPLFDCNKFNRALDSNGPYYCDIDNGPSSWAMPFIAPSLESAKKAMEFLSSGWGDFRGINCVNANGESTYIKGSDDTYDGEFDYPFKYPYKELQHSYGNVKFFSS